MLFHTYRRPCWRRWLGLSEIWAGGGLSVRVLVLLRWLAAIGQGVTLMIGWYIGVELPWWQCVSAISLTVVTNAILEWWARQIQWELREGFFHVLLWDVLTLTFLLHWTGGLRNPLVLFYLVQLTLAAVVLKTSAVIGLGMLAFGAFFWLWERAIPLHMAGGGPMSEEIWTRGFLSALALTCTCVLTLLLALRRHSYRLQKERERLRLELEQRERFLSVAALATGFAHELGTPLGTIALAAEELRIHPDESAVSIVIHEVERCRKVLQRLRELGQEATGRSAEPCQIVAVVQEVLDEISTAHRQRIELSADCGEMLIACAGLREALLVLLRNALLASADEKPVHLRVCAGDGWIRFIVEDHGSGFSAEMLRHWGEPFRTTRSSYGGMGLGLFFVRRLAASAQGNVRVENCDEGGARVTLILPQYRPAS